MTTIRKLWKENICYKALLLILLLLMLVPYLHQELAPLAKIFLIWGYGYIIYDFVTGRTLWKRRSLFLLLGFCACYAVTIFLNRETAFTTNLKALLYMSMLFILLSNWDSLRLLPAVVLLFYSEVDRLRWRLLLLPPGLVI